MKECNDYISVAVQEERKTSGSALGSTEVVIGCFIL